MTSGQERAVRELERLHFADPASFELLETPQLDNGFLRVTVSLRLGPLERKLGGLDLKEREEFVVQVHPDFPFEKPSLSVTHDRFAGFPHVNWKKYICLYQSNVEWNPADGLYGFFDRLALWLKRAALNDMDPVEGPLHPPVLISDWASPPFIIRANMPVASGDFWIGCAEIKKYTNRMELVGWNDFTGEFPQECFPALSVVLPNAVPVEFPIDGKAFFAELEKQGIDRDRVLTYLRIASKLSPPDDRAYIILAFPMRRSPDGRAKHYIAIWSIDADKAENLRVASASASDTEELKEIKDKINRLIYEIFELVPIKWCPVMEARSDIVVRRDTGSPLAWFSGKKILVLGCGALGSWSAEIIARANPSLIHLVDTAMVKPGLLARQNYELSDIGSSKAAALRKRLLAIVPECHVEQFTLEAHRFLTDNLDRIAGYDLILDCTASLIFQMKLERDWKQLCKRTPLVISIIIDGTCRSCLAVILAAGSAGGIFDSYLKLKYRLCCDGRARHIVDAFYSERSNKDLFQPEPGCSDPTFSGSTADVGSLICTALNLSIGNAQIKNMPMGVAFSSHNTVSGPGSLNMHNLHHSQLVELRRYRVFISINIYREVRAWVRQNKRLRSDKHETGGLLWGYWDDAVGAIWVLDVSGPPKDSIHDPGHFICGIEGTRAEHERRVKRTFGSCGFVGFWHTHPAMPSRQSIRDIGGMTGLVSHQGLNQKRNLMIIFGRTFEHPTAGVYVYESESLDMSEEMIAVDEAQITLEAAVV